VLDISKEKNSKMKSFFKYLKVLIGIIIISSIGVIVEDYFKYSKTNQSDKTINLNLQKISEEINKKCPMTVDKETRLDNTIILSQKTIQYNYTWVNLEKEDIYFDYVEANFKPLVIENVRTNPGLKTLKDSKIVFSYYYKDKNGRFAYKLKVTPDMYE